MDDNESWETHRDRFGYEYKSTPGALKNADTRAVVDRIGFRGLLGVVFAIVTTMTLLLGWVIAALWNAGLSATLFALPLPIAWLIALPIVLRLVGVKVYLGR